MIEEYRFGLAIESFRMYKAYITCIHGNLIEPEHSYLVRENYDGLVGSFMAATVHPQLSAMFDLYDSLDEDYCSFCEYDTFDSFLNYGYTYTCELEPAPEDLNDEWYNNPEPIISSNGILLNNVHDFYNYWVLNQLPENPVYKEVSFSSCDSDAIARKYITEVRKRCFPDDYFVI